MRTAVGVTVMTLAWLAPMSFAEAAAPATAQAAPPGATCAGLRATIVGTQGDDRLRGTRGRDVIAALGGHDRVAGRGGDDVICGGRGSDVLDGGGGADALLGGLDRVEGGSTPYHRGDWLSGGPGDDRIDAGHDPRWRGERTGGDVVSWAASPRGVRVDLARGWARGHGNDRVVVVEGRVYLTEHADTLVGTSGPEEVHALGGEDTIRARGGDDVLWLDEQETVDDDRARTGAGDDEVHSRGGSDRIVAADGGDLVTLSGRQVEPRVELGEGRDRLEAVLPSSSAPDTTGGPGHDLVLLVLTGGLDSTHSLDLATGMLLTGEVAAQMARFEDAELYGGRYAVRGTGDANRVTVNLASSFLGRGGDDEFIGSAGDDEFDGGAGTDGYLSDSGGTNTCASVEEDPWGACAADRGRAG